MLWEFYCNLYVWFYKVFELTDWNEKLGVLVVLMEWRGQQIIRILPLGIMNIWTKFNDISTIIKVFDFRKKVRTDWPTLYTHTQYKHLQLTNIYVCFQ